MKDHFGNEYIVKKYDTDTFTISTIEYNHPNMGISPVGVLIKTLMSDYEFVPIVQWSRNLSLDEVKKIVGIFEKA